jgi:RNA polymerase sigma-70 factor, ECF subfamily
MATACVTRWRRVMQDRGSKARGHMHAGCVAEGRGRSGMARSLERPLKPTSAAPETASGTPVDTERLYREGLCRVYEEHLQDIYRFIYSKVGNREDAEDLTAQVYLKAIRSLDSTREAHSVRSWLFHVARTTIADHWRWFYQLRAHSLEELLARGWDGPAQEPGGESLGTPAERVQRLLPKLPPRYRAVLTCRFLWNASIKETAAQMGISEANVKVLQYRALRKASQLEGTE